LARVPIGVFAGSHASLISLAPSAIGLGGL